MVGTLVAIFILGFLVLVHEAGHPMPATGHAVPNQLRMNPRRAVDAVAGLVDASDRLDQTGIGLAACAGWARQ